ncbi:MAG: cupin domain-containing protein [Geobacteraceae bacterium]|nr:cupin domain-containing protein [Geobacteraceae bacterium]
MTAARISNIFATLPDSSDEIFETLLAKSGLKIERIISTGQATPPGEWYDQKMDEWVLLLSGSARLLIDGEPAPRSLLPGDYLHLPAHCRHRVEQTDQQVKTIWLALHFQP